MHLISQPLWKLKECQLFSNYISGTAAKLKLSLKKCTNGKMYEYVQIFIVVR